MNLFDQLIVNTYTVSDLRRRIQLMKAYLNEKLFANEPKLPQDIDDVDRRWLDSLKLAGITKDNLSENLDTLEKEAKKVEPLILFLAFTLAEKEVAELGQKVREDLGRNILIETRLDPLLIAGAAVAYKGVYKDYSIRQNLKDNHDGLVANFKKYMR